MVQPRKSILCESHILVQVVTERKTHRSNELCRLQVYYLLSPSLNYSKVHHLLNVKNCHVSEDVNTVNVFDTGV